MNRESLEGARVLVTGATGFLGKHLVRHLQEGYDADVMALGGPRSASSPDEACDLVHSIDAQMLFELEKGTIEYVFHLAGYNGGIEFNLKNPADVFYRNTAMGLNVIDSAYRYGVKKLVSVVASCSYGDEPKLQVLGNHSGVYQESDFFFGRPDDSVACHGYAKRNLQLASSFYRKQYGFIAVCACPTTLYGPGDSFDPQRTKVMGAMVKRFVDAQAQGLPSVTCWGSGLAQREFLYVEDCPKLLVETMLRYDDSDLPLNLGTGQEVAIRELTRLVADGVGYQGEVLWDTSKPDGQLRKRLDLSRMNAILQQDPATPLREGIRKTIAYYKETLSA